MENRVKHRWGYWIIVFLSTLVVVFSGSRTARAQVEMAPTQPVRIDTERERDLPFYPPLVVTGSVLFLGAYVPSLIYAKSPSNNNDTALKYPVVGPWIDLAKQDCVTNNCDPKSTNGAFLILDGVVQGLGILTMATGFLLPERTVKRWRERRVLITPLRMGAGNVGAGALGSF